MFPRTNFGFLLKRYTCLKFNTDDLLNFFANIDVKTNNPFDLYRDWLKDLPNSVSNSYWSLANYSKKNNRVQNRFVKIFHLDDKLKNRFVFITDGRTKKCQDFIICPNVSISILWQYEDMDHKVQVIRQIRADGKLKKCSSELCSQVFDKLSFCARIRWHLCEQNKKLHSWCILQHAYQNVIKDIKSEITHKSSDIVMPHYMAAYEIDIDRMYFFHSILGQKTKFVPDRVVFEKVSNDSNKWRHTHITS